MPVLEIIKTGNYKDFEITEEILDSIVKNAFERTPIVYGHEQWYFSPGAGIIEKADLRKEGQSLYAELKLSEAAQKAWDDVEYRNWSAGISKIVESKVEDGKTSVVTLGYVMDHLALLGNIPPAIRDLKIVELSNKSGKTEFVKIDKEDVEKINLSKKEEDEMKEEIKISEEMRILQEENQRLQKDLENFKKIEFSNKVEKTLLEFSDRIPIEALKKFSAEISSEAELDRIKNFCGSIPKMVAEPQKIELSTNIESEKSLRKLV